MAEKEISEDNDKAKQISLRKSRRTEVTFDLSSLESTLKKQPRFTINPRLTQMFQSINVHRLREPETVKPKLKFHPTYRLESKNPFDYRVVGDLIKKTVEAQMEARGKITFDESTAIPLCRSLSEEVSSVVKAKNYDRYRIIVTVTAGEKNHQSYHQKAAFLWDSETDAMASYVYERSDMFIITTVFGIYYD